MSHTCHAYGCTKVVPPRLFLCAKHWYMLPQEMRDAVWREYREGQEVRKDPTSAYLRVADEAIAWLRQREEEIAAQPPAPKKQGTLFE